MRRAFLQIWPIVLLLLLSFFFHAKLFFPPSLYSSADFGRGDLTHFNYPMKFFLSESFKNFQLPLWTPEIFTGFPAFAESQIGTFYLPNLILFFLLPTWLAFNLNYVLASFIAAAGTYYYCRFLQLGKVSSLIGSIAFSFSMFFVGQTIHFNVIQVSSLLPWLFLVLEKFLKEQKLIYLLGFSFILSQQVFAGFAQLTVYSLIGLVILLGFRLLVLNNRLLGARNLVFFLLACTLGFSLAAIQILPSMEFREFSTRGGVLSLSQIFEFPFATKDLIAFVNPYFFGDPSQATFQPYSPARGIFWENAGYIGLLPLFFALLTLFLRQKGQGLFIFPKTNLFIFWGLFAISILLALGKFSPFYIFYELPPFSYFRVPSRFLLLATLALSVLAAIGWENIQKKFFDKKKFSVFLGIIILFFIFIDLYRTSAPYNGPVALETWLATPSTAQFLQNDKDTFRIYSIGQFDNWYRIYENYSHGWRSETAPLLLSTRTILDPDTNIIWGIFQTSGYAGTSTRRMAYLSSLTEQGITQTNDKITIASSSGRLLAMQDVKYVVTTKMLTNPEFEKKFETENVPTNITYYIYQNKLVLPRIRLVGQAEIAKSVQDLGEKINNPTFDPKTTAILEKEVSIDVKDINGAQINIIKDGNQRLEFEVNSTEGGILVLADSFYPGWQASIDSVENEILAANINQRALVLTSGKHKIVFQYTPKSIQYGAIVSVISFILLFSLFLSQRKLTKIFRGAK